MKAVIIIFIVFLFVSCLALGYIDYRHLKNDYTLELKIKKINAKNKAMLNKINAFCFEFKSKQDIKNNLKEVSK